jgi:hypothetical protein
MVTPDPPSFASRFSRRYLRGCLESFPNIRNSFACNTRLVRVTKIVSRVVVADVRAAREFFPAALVPTVPGFPFLA